MSNPRRSTYVRIRIRWDRIAAAIALGIVLAALAWWWLSIATEVNEDPYAGVPRCTDAIADAGGICHGEPLPPCPTEDSHDCYWDARTMGNGEGRSFIDEGGSQTFGNP